jgi:phage terminase small subunit
MPKQLTSKQKRWAENYAKNGANALQAARDAGYAEKSLKRIAWKNQVESGIREYLKTLTAPQTQAEKVRIADAKERAEFLTSMMRGEVKAPYVTRDGMQNDQPSHEARIKAAVELAKIQGDYAPVRLEHTGRISFQDFVSDDPLEGAPPDDEA